MANARKEFMVHTNFNCHNEKKQRRSERAKKEAALFLSRGVSTLCRNVGKIQI